MARVDYDQMASSYEHGRAMPLDALEDWRAALAAYLPPASRLPVLDLGAGTGLFATALATWFEVRVVGVEPDGPVLIRSSFPDRHERITLFRFFPGARRVAETFPTVEATVAAFAAAGFAFQALRPVAQVSAQSLREAVDRVRVRADSTLRLLPDEEFAEGLAALERATAAETTPTLVVDHLDLLVLR
jgi:hypothetical protein